MDTEFPSCLAVKVPARHHKNIDDGSVTKGVCLRRTSANTQINNNTTNNRLYLDTDIPYRIEKHLFHALRSKLPAEAYIPRSISFNTFPPWITTVGPDNREGR